jgi:hypothetical protein
MEPTPLSSHESLQRARQRDLTSDALHSLLEKGVPYDQASESVREEWAFLPSEEDPACATLPDDED